MLNRNSNSGLEETGSELISSRTRMDKIMSPDIFHDDYGLKRMQKITK